MKPRRVLLKLSGEVLGSESQGINPKACVKVAQTIKSLNDAHIQVAIVLGGGNIFRGVIAQELGMIRVAADQMGMLATVLNGLALQQALQTIQCPVKVLSAINCPSVVESYQWSKAREYLDQQHVVLFVGGTGNPYFTTDTAAALRASEIQADVLLKATKVEGVYNKDPLKHADAKKYDHLSYSQVLAEKLGVMDATSIVLCRNNEIPIFVFHMNLLTPEKIVEVAFQRVSGTTIDS